MPTCTNMCQQPYINLYHKQVHQPCTNLYLNLYHQRVHQPCTKYVPIMHQIHINYDSSRCTNIINYTPHVCANSSTTCLNHVPKYVPIMHQLHTSCMCQLINYLSQPCTQHVPQPYTKDIHQYNHQNLSNNSSLYP
jgi:hypothetical protein